MYPISTSTHTAPSRFTKLHTAALGTALLALPILQAAAADVTLPPVSIGAGMRTSYTHDAPNSGTDTDSISLDSARLYINGSVTDKIKFTFNTEYNGSTDSLLLMDAIAQFNFSDQFHVWAGRFLPPVDRANLYGPYYANDWNPYADNVADFYPSVAIGRDNGVAYWGQFGMLKASVGVFDGKSLNDGKAGLLTAARLMMDFWDVEGGYYLNSTYYGEKDLLAVGVAAQDQGGVKSISGDFLMEKKIGGGGAVTVEAEYQKDDGLIAPSKGYYVLGAYTFPEIVGVGKFQPLIKFSKKTFEHGLSPDTDQKTTEVNLNYIIKSFNARISLFYLSTKIDPVNTTDNKFGLGLQIQM